MTLSYVIAPEDSEDDNRFRFLKRAKLPDLAPGDEWYEYDPESKALHCLNKDGHRARRAASGHRVRVSRNPHALQLSFATILEDETHEGHAYQLQLEGVFRIACPATCFLGARSVWLTQGLGVTAAEISTHLETQLRDRVFDAVRDVDPQQLEHDLPVSWWNTMLAAWGEELGFELNIASVRCHSETLRSSRERQAKIVREQQLVELRFEIQEKRAKHEAALEEIRRSEQNRARESDREAREEEHAVALRRKRQLIELRQVEEEELRLELDYARLQNELRTEQADFSGIEEGQRAIEDRQEQITEQCEQITEQCEEVAVQCQQIAARLENLPLDLLEDIRRVQPERPNDLAWRFDLPPGVLEYFGAWTRNAELIRLFEERQASDHAVTLRMPALATTRDLVAVKKQNVLSVGDPLNLQITTKRSGYLTLLNIGTSGRCWVQVPNEFVEADNTWIESQRGPHSLPDAELLALDRHDLMFIEAGPVGWEHMVAVLSNEPLFGGLQPTEGTPFSEVDAGEVIARLGAHDERNESPWSAAALSFVVTSPVCVA